MSFTEALRYLDRHINLEARAGYFEDLSLNSMEKLMELSGDPNKAFRSIHVTGTNGKGSTATMFARLLQAQGLRVGRYSSPHLASITETHGISRHEDGQIRSEDPAGEHGDDTMVSMNMFGFPQSLFPHLQSQWESFYDEFGSEPKTEYLLPDVVDRLRESGEMTVVVPVSAEEWIGVTNPNDLEPARAKLAHR